MENTLIYFILGFIGLCFGSFAGATVWRLRAAQLTSDKADGYEVDELELKRLKKLHGRSVRGDRSVCLNCNHQLEWYDLIPLVSWLSLRGRCRYCHTPIGWMEPLIELGVAAFFVLSFTFWPVELAAFNSAIEIIRFILWLLAGVGLAILFVYDAKWFLLPNIIMWPVIVIAAIVAGLTIYGDPEPAARTLSLVAGIAILSGLYWALYQISKWKNGEDGTWIGFGDVKLGLGLALLLVDWRLAFMTLFLANAIGFLLVIPGLITGKLDRQAHIPFGPLLIIGFLLAALFGEQIIALYFGLL